MLDQPYIRSDVLLPGSKERDWHGPGQEQLRDEVWIEGVRDFGVVMIPNSKTQPYQPSDCLYQVHTQLGTVQIG